MALSTSEHNLLVNTCENMNVAAGTCREVLEMLRNLGNTGVVDIATHNNTPGAHASDPTIEHVFSFTGGKNLPLGDILYPGYGASQWPATLIYYDTDGVSSACLLASDTRGSYAGNKSYLRTETYLTDSDGDRVAFSSYNQSKIVNNGFALFTGYLKDKDSNQLYCGIKYTAGRNAGRGDAVDITSAPYSNIQFFTSDSLTTAQTPFSIDNLGLLPGATNVYSIGNASRTLKDIFVHNAVTVTSDRREKTDVSVLDSKAVSFINALRPVEFKLIEGEGAIERVNTKDDTPAETIPAKTGVRPHWGFIAQEVKGALSTAGIEDAAVWCLEDKDDPDSRQSLRYEELIAPLVKAVQVLAAKVEALEGK